MHESLEFLVEHLPPGLHLVLASRADPPLPLARLRAAGQLAELRAGDLRFTADEAAALLRESAGADLCVPRTSSTSRDQAVFVDQATDASLSSYAVPVEVDRFG